MGVYGAVCSNNGNHPIAASKDSLLVILKHIIIMSIVSNLSINVSLVFYIK